MAGLAEASDILKGLGTGRIEVKDPTLLLRGLGVSRLMKPDDANLAGNVHGGSILRMIEEAGSVIATRYCNLARPESKNESVFAVMARVEKMDFLQPVYIGELAQLQAEICYTASHSLQVAVSVDAENIFTGNKRRTNCATLWYVPLDNQGRASEVPQMTYDDPEQYKRGLADYERQKAERSQPRNLPKTTSISGMDPGHAELSIAYSRTSLTHVVGVSDCFLGGYCKGGVMLKLMDECAGIVARKHCKTNVVTVSMDATNFHSPVTRGGLICLMGQITYTSDKSIEIQVIADVETFKDGSRVCKRAVDSYFIFVSLDTDGKAQKVPPLKLTNAADSEAFEDGKRRYFARKELRKSSR